MESEDESSSSESSNEIEVYCHRCLRSNHNFRECHAVNDLNGLLIEDVQENFCYRCGKHNHAWRECYAKYDIDGALLG